MNRGAGDAATTKRSWGLGVGQEAGMGLCTCQREKHCQDVGTGLWELGQQSGSSWGCWSEEPAQPGSREQPCWKEEASRQPLNLLCADSHKIITQLPMPQQAPDFH